MTNASVRQAITRGRLTEGDAFIDGVVHKGVVLIPWRLIGGWSPKICDQILFSHGVDPDGEGHAYLTTREDE